MASKAPISGWERGSPRPCPRRWRRWQTEWCGNLGWWKELTTMAMLVPGDAEEEDATPPAARNLNDKEDV